MSKSPVLLAVLLLASPLAAAEPPGAAGPFLGKVETSTTVIITPRVTGYLTQVNVKEGSLVKKGEILAQIDSRAFEADVKLAMAQFAAEEAKVKLAESDYSRVSEMYKKGVAGGEDMKRAEAAAMQAKATIAVAQATLQKAQLMLEQTRLVSPIDGRVERIALDPGNLVTADTTKLALIVRTDPVVIVFTVDEATALKLRASVLKDSSPISIVGVSDKSLTAQGVIESVGGTVETDGTLKIRAVAANPKGEFLPGMTVQVSLPAK